MFQSPQRGLFISYFAPYEAGESKFVKQFQSPQRGLFISYPITLTPVSPRFAVSVPSAGIVYFLHDLAVKLESWVKGFVSVPSAGIVYFLPVRQCSRRLYHGGFSPLSGDCLFLTLILAGALSACGTVSVPSAGIVYFLRITALQYYPANVFQSPQRGLFISYALYKIKRIVRIWFQSPQRGLFISYGRRNSRLHQ